MRNHPSANFATILLAAITIGPMSAWGQSASSNTPLIVLDPGHGGEQDGAHGICGSTEKSVVLSIAKQVRDLIRFSGRARVRLTREDDRDIPLEARAELANTLDAELFVSIHANASTNTAAKGTETFFLSTRSASRRVLSLAARENAQSEDERVQDADDLQAVLASLELGASHQGSQRLALDIQKQLGQKVGAAGRGVLQAPFVVLRGAKMPAVLVEVGFLTHPDECEALASPSHQRKVAQSIAIALLLNLAQTRA